MEMLLREGIAGRIAVPEDDRDVLVFDTNQRGFFLRKFKSGRAVWGVKYSVGNKQRRLHLYDATVRGTLAKARKEAADVRAKARLGMDAIAEKRAAAEAAKNAITVAKLAERYLSDRRPSWRPRYYLEVERHLMKDWRPLSAMVVGAIGRPDVVKVIDKLASEQGRVAADRARAALSGLYTWAIDRGYCSATPVVHIKSRAGNVARERTLSPAELRQVWLATDAVDHLGDRIVSEDYSRIVKLLILTGQRRDEIGALRWPEIFEADGGNGRIELSGDRTKNRRPHMVILADRAKQVLPAKRNGTDFLFGRLGTGFSGWSKAKAELDIALVAMRAKLGNSEPITAWRLHDLRRTFVTLLGELGFAAPHVVEAIVNHVSGHKAGVAGTYNKALYLEERHQAMDAWGRYVASTIAVSAIASRKV
jgi:integrase